MFIFYPLNFGFLYKNALIEAICHCINNADFDFISILALIRVSLEWCDLACLLV